MLDLENYRSWFEERGMAAAATTHAPDPALLEPDFSAYRNAIMAGFHAGMTHLERLESERRSWEAVLPGAASLISIAVPYGMNSESASQSPLSLSPLTARFARVDNYHHAVKSALDELIQEISQGIQGHFQWRAVVDTAPLLEKAHARLARLGGMGKNTLLITPARGSWVVLGEILTTAPLKPWTLHPPRHIMCGDCHRCLDACPTGALVAPYRLDARKCLSYLTIEHRGPVPLEFLPHFSHTVFGCDDCQRCCPYNQRLPEGENSASIILKSVNWDEWDVVSLARATRREFERAFGATSLQRARHEGMVRNLIYHLAATGNSSLPRIASHWRNRQSKSIHAILDQLLHAGWPTG